MRKAKDPGFLRRCQIVLNYAANRGCTTTAEVLDCAPATAVRVAHRFLEGGLEALDDRRADNGDLLRDDDLLQAVAELLCGHPEDHGWQRPTWTRELLALTLADLHDNVTRNHRCAHLDALMEEVEGWLNRPPGQRTGAGLAA